VVERGEKGMRGKGRELMRMDLMVGRSEFWRESYRYEGRIGRNPGKWGALLGPVPEINRRAVDGILIEVEREVIRAGEVKPNYHHHHPCPGIITCRDGDIIQESKQNSKP